MDITTIWEELAWEKGGKIIYLILDGLGGLPDSEKGGTELQVAKTPNLDRLAEQSSCGLLEIVGPGITPGSGPGHLALFGYDPLKYKVGRGVLSALGIEFDLKEGDVAARVNFASINQNGEVTDRRAGRIDTNTNRQLCKKIREKVTLDFDGEYFFETVSEHRAVFVLRGSELGGSLEDTDPQMTGVSPQEPKAKSEDSQKTAEIVRSFIHQVREVLADEHPANMILMRGFEKYQPFPSLEKRFGLKGVCVADYPMYRGVSRLLGLDVLPRPGGLKERFQALQSCYGDKYNFYFLHVKHSDSEGEDANFDGKVKVLEEVDKLLPIVTELNPDVLVVTGDHSTPAVMGQHSWHPVPVMIYGKFVRIDRVTTFDEYACEIGSLGIRPGNHLMGLALAHAGRLRKYGA
ncbi:MAG: 2,3-bisphosphoglycerate-independent phosphoglycerate mutase [Scytonema sp. PMC 1069.18]|nr:2,3-bisphosphoglycerate-independent phosphoglycerate mutase [Scytonema sp. PMC 1069.18]MEC4882618.1 2,3-bisphosphoglycerate-independent phosphoglycerate mutase [Scytonema sp. PMC 1070.18]